MKRRFFLTALAAAPLAALVPLQLAKPVLSFEAEDGFGQGLTATVRIQTSDIEHVFERVPLTPVKGGFTLPDCKLEAHGQMWIAGMTVTLCGKTVQMPVPNVPIYIANGNTVTFTWENRIAVSLT